MPYPTPNLSTLRAQALQDIQSSNITDGNGNVITVLLQKSVLRVLALVQAGMAYLFFRFLDFIALQGTPFTATGEWLEGWMALKGVTRIPPAPATGTATFTGTNGYTIPAQYTITRGDGTSYFSTTAGTVSALSVTVPVQATVPGSDGTILPGTGCSLSGPLTGINGAGTFTASTTPGIDVESDASLRTRGLRAYANPPLGGADSDYVEWATSVPGVTRAWAIANWNSITGSAAVGVVSVLFMEDEVRSAEQGIPQGTNGVSTSETRNTGGSGAYPLATGDQLAVASYIFPVRPVTALVVAAAPATNGVTYTLSTLYPNTTEILDGIEAALLDMHQRTATPGGTLRPDGLPGGELYESDWDAAAASVPGVLEFSFSSPSGTVTSATGTIPTVGTVTVA